MHVRSELALPFLIIIGVTPVCAADLFEMPYTGMRATQLVIYDYQLGVTMRPYWLAPWRQHHYFPWTGKAPKLGRLERSSADHRPVPAESFYRVWSTSQPF
jgi:hypothetical protein